MKRETKHQGFHGENISAGQSYSKYLTILESLSGGIIAIDRNGVISMANKQANNIFEDDLTGKNLIKKVSAIRDVVTKVFQNSVLSGEVVYRVKGREKVIGYTVSPITGSSGIEGAVFNLKDITGIREIHESIRHTERLASIGTLVREVAHEVRNPLAAIKGITQMIGEDLDDKDPKKVYIDAVMKEIDRLNRVVDNLLQRGRNEMVKLKEVLHRSVLLCSRDDRWKDVKIVEEYDETLELGEIDEKLSQAFYNIILNAFESVETRGEVIVRSKKDGSHAVIEIISSSVIDRKIIGRIFEEGFTTKKKGHGIGLKVALDVVKKAGGDISVEPLSRRTKFIVRLPLGY